MRDDSIDAIAYAIKAKNMYDMKEGYYELLANVLSVVVILTSIAGIALLIVLSMLLARC